MTASKHPATAAGAEASVASRRFYRLARAIVVGFMRLWFRIEVRGADRIPASGGFILAPGAHRSIADTPLVCAVTPRMLRYMGAERYFAVPVLGPFLRAVGGFAVERDATDREALRVSESILALGEPLVVFPESTRGSGPLVGELKEGAAFLACRAGVPVVPVGVGGAERVLPKGGRFPRPRKVVLVVGSPIVPPQREPGARVKRSQVRALTTELGSALQLQFDAAQIAAGA